MNRTAGSGKADVAAIVFAAVCPTLVTLVYFVLVSEQAPRLQQTAYGIGKVIQFAFPITWVALVQRSFRSPVGVAKEQRWKLPKALLFGVSFGLLVLVGMALLYFLLLEPNSLLDEAEPQIQDRVRDFQIDSFWKYATLGLFYALLHSFLEEYYFRWFVYGQMRRFMQPNMAILLSSVAFMAHHVIVLSQFFGWWSFWAVLFSVSVAVGGAVWAWLYERSGSIVAPWISHLIIDAAIFLIGYDMALPTG